MTLKKWSGVLLLLWASIAAMLVGLAGLIAFVHSASVRIDRMNRVVAEDTSPSLVALQSLNFDISGLQNALREQLRAPGSNGALAAHVERGRGALARDVVAYLALPIDPGEAKVIDDLKHDLERFGNVTDRILATTSGTPRRVREELRTELDEAANALDHRILSAASINAAISDAAIQELRRAGRHILPGAVALEAVSGLCAALAMIAAYRMSRREAALGERRLLEKKNAELEAFSGRVAHDLMSPLMSVSLAVGLAEQRLSSPGDERLCAMMGRASRTLQRVRQMVTDLLDFARAAAQPPPGTRTEVAPVLEELVSDLQPVASEAGVELRLLGASHRCVPCAAGILSTVMSNLMHNAIRYARQRPERRVDVRAVDVDAEVRFEVEDTGPGIAPEDREKIFEPYVSRSPGGSGLGLGLATVKRLAESHGGHVGVRSDPGHGALFWVTLPAAA